jgi:UDP-N-acetylmuramoyl-L-alanyl-D-glutamate--2,6-diaminopimelate ligase
MNLSDLLPDSGLAGQVAGAQVAGLTADSRAVQPGFVFFAVPGAKADGLSFLPQAVRNGAIAIVTERAPETPPPGVAVVLVDNVRLALSRAAARFHPRQPATIAAVTGTSGKTSVAAFTRQIWLKLGHPAASLGTLGVVAPSGAVYGSLTTPDPVTLHRTLDELAGEGVTHLAMEASSHGLDQRRLDGVRLAAGAFTNLSRDHLDYHATFEDYLKAKLRLFEDLLQPGQSAVIDADNDVADRVIAAARARGLNVLTIGAKGEFLRIVSTKAEGFATRLVVDHGGQSREIVLPLAGTFQGSNALIAAALAMATGGAAGDVLATLETLAGAPGRLELAGRRGTAPIVIDYAHKPDALEKGLRALRPFASGRLIVVFGCGGDRDAGKRPIMGGIAAREADYVIVTDDNPRSEDPAAIRAAILAGVLAEGQKNVEEIGDRAQAIAAGVALLQDGDVLLVAGKGHETGQIVGNEVLPFSDHEAVQAALKGYAQ